MLLTGGLASGVPVWFLAIVLVMTVVLSLIAIQQPACHRLRDQGFSSGRQSRSSAV